MSGQRQLLEHHLAPVRALMEPADVTELVINRPYEAGVEQGGKWTWHDVPEMSFDWLMTLARAAAAATKQDIRPDAPLVSTVLPTGERCQFLIPPATLEGIVSVTMRKPSAVPPHTMNSAALRIIVSKQKKNVWTG